MAELYKPRSLVELRCKSCKTCGEIAIQKNAPTTLTFYNKVPLNAENTLMLFKERRPFKFKKNVHRIKRKP
jgi:hypothetical protein